MGISIELLECGISSFSCPSIKWNEIRNSFIYSFSNKSEFVWGIAGLRMFGGDQLEGVRDITLWFVDLLRDDLVEKDFIEKYRNRNVYFT